jgi:hypothetical protein
MRRLPRNFHAIDHHDTSAPPHCTVLFPARTVLPFLRTPLGYNMVHPGAALTGAIALCFLPLVFWALYAGVRQPHIPDNIGHTWLMGFAVVSFLATCLIFARRAIGQRRGTQIHTSEAGYCYLTWRTDLPVPLCEQIIVPAALMCLGWLIAHSVSFELGWWLVVCGVSYLVMARWEYTRRLAQTRTTVDDMIRAESFEERLDSHEQAARRQKAKPSSAGAQPSYAFSDEPSLVTLGGEDERPARAPDMATWSEDNASVVPSAMGWLRRARGRPRR